MSGPGSDHGAAGTAACHQQRSVHPLREVYGSMSPERDPAEFRERIPAGRSGRSGSRPRFRRTGGTRSGLWRTGRTRPRTRSGTGPRYRTGAGQRHGPRRRPRGGKRVGPRPGTVEPAWPGSAGFLRRHVAQHNHKINAEAGAGSAAPLYSGGRRHAGSSLWKGILPLDVPHRLHR